MDWLILALAFVVLIAMVAWRYTRRTTRAIRTMRASERLASGYCPACAYDLAGSELKRQQCPECGHTLTDAQFKRLSNIAPYLLRAREHPR